MYFIHKYIIQQDDGKVVRGGSVTWQYFEFIPTNGVMTKVMH